MLRAFLFLIGFFSTPTVANEVALNGSIINMHPWGFAENGILKGRHPDLIKELEKRSGLKLNYKLTPLKRISFELENEKTDFSLILLRDQFKNLVHIVEEIEDLSLKLLMRKGLPLEQKTKIKKMGILLGEKKMLQPHLISNSIYPKSLIQKNTFFQLFDLLRGKRVEGVVYLGDALDRYLKKHQIQRSEFGGEAQLLEKKAYFYLSNMLGNRVGPIGKKLKEAILSMKKDGTLDRINNRFFPLPQ